jgi:hypothetical protein
MDRDRIRHLHHLAEDSQESFQVLRAELQKFGNDVDRLADECKGIGLRIKRRMGHRAQGEANKAIVVLEKAAVALGEAGQYLASAANRMQKAPPQGKKSENPRLSKPWLQGPHRVPFVTAPGTGFNSS